MIKKTKKVIKKIPGQLHHHSILAIFLGFLAIGFSVLAIKNSVNAQDTVTISTTDAKVVCSYQTGEWSECSSSGTQTRTVTRTPDGCYDAESIPARIQKCTYAAPCSFSYSNWSDCNSTGYQTRTVSARTPVGCYDSAEPILKQQCTYVAATTSVTKIACSYEYSSWGDCKSSGKQARTVVKRPTGCYEPYAPVLERSCSYGGSSDSTETQTLTRELDVTPQFNFLNLSGGEVLSGEIKLQGTVKGATSVEFYLISVESNNPKYLGLAKLNDKNVWEYSLDTKSQPNGSFFIRPKIKNTYGVYEGQKRMIIILNANEEIKTALENSANAELKNEIRNRISAEWQEKYFKSNACVDEKICGGESDPDGDGVTNNEEYRLGSNPTNPDTDQDGFLDGDEIKNGFNPVKPSPGDKSDKMIFESPKEKGEIKKDLYKVEKVELVDGDGAKKLKLNGTALPNSYITIYIYSDPIVLTVKTDDQGNWSYVLDKNIEDGDHEVYVAVTDNTGKITAKSEPVAFVKTAQAANIVMPAEAAAQERAISPTKSWSNNNLYFFITIAIGMLALAIATLGLIKHNLNKKEKIDLL